MEESVKAIKRWLEKCNEKHALSTCTSPSGNFPKRLIYLDSETRMACLIDTPQGEPRPRYIALSYCWGHSEHNLTTTTDTLGKRMKNIPIGKLGATLKDVFELVLNLGEKYLWIDALCILQGDKDEWERESRNMGGV